jgi:hypothetical protein
MRRLLALPLALPLLLPAALFALASCNESDPEALYIDIRYQLRCIDCEPASNDAPARDVHHLDGDDDFDLSCNATSTDDGRLVSFAAEYFDPDNDANNYAIEVDQAGLDGASHGASCSVKVLDGNSTYKGRCADGDPTVDNPCQLDLKKEGTAIRGTITCRKIPLLDSTTPFRYLVHPNSSRAATIEIRGCTF